MEVRREQLALQYAVKVSADPSNPAYDCLYSDNYKQFYLSSPRKIKPLALRIEDPLSSLCPDTKILLPRQSVFTIPYWTLKCPEMDTTMTKYKKSETNACELQHHFHDLTARYPGYLHVFTDGSKDDSRVACAATGSNLILQIRLLSAASIYTAELSAIFESMKMLRDSVCDGVLIISDSLSALDAIQNMDFRHPIVIKILALYTELSSFKDIVFMWCPSHVGIRGNERADSLAKEALDFTPCHFQIPSKDFKSDIRKLCHSKWQALWDESVPNKLHEINPMMVAWPKRHREDRREEVVLARARIGHTHLTHSYLLKREDMPECFGCSCPLTVKHILIECVDFNHIRPRFYRVASMKQLFNEVEPTKVLNFLKAIGLFYRF
jgi:ribonuclease HI